MKSATRLAIATDVGRLQSQESVVHLVADELWQPALPAPVTTAPSRDFH